MLKRVKKGNIDIDSEPASKPWLKARTWSNSQNGEVNQCACSDDEEHPYHMAIPPDGPFILGPFPPAKGGLETPGRCRWLLHQMGRSITLYLITHLMNQTSWPMTSEWNLKRQSRVQLYK